MCMTRLVITEQDHLLNKDKYHTFTEGIKITSNASHRFVVLSAKLKTIYRGCGPHTVIQFRLSELTHWKNTESARESGRHCTCDISFLSFYLLFSCPRHLGKKHEKNYQKMEHPKNICGVAKFFKQKSAVARLRVQQKNIESQQKRLRQEEELMRQRRQREEDILRETTAYWRKISLPARLEKVS